MFNSKPRTKPKITWVTPDYFVDCDFNPDILKVILEQYDIHWLILLPGKNARFTESEFETISKLPGMEIEFIYWMSRARNLKMLIFYEQVYRRIKSINSSLVYFNYVPESPYVLPLYWRLNKNKTIFTAHDGNVKPSFSIPWLSKMVFKLSFSTVKFINMFSVTQASLFRTNFARPQIFIIPLGLKNFGVSKLDKRKDNVIFLFFGSIHANKNLEMLINAACNLHEEGAYGFKVAIHGFGDDWDYYQSKIKYHELFECDIRLHRNDEIPDLFAQSHYVVFPYKELSQSGALKVAFNYNVPVIVSDLKGFTDEVEEGVNGYIFRSEKTEDLQRLMLRLLKNHTVQYESLRSKIIEYNTEHYSKEVLSKKYLDMFNEVKSVDNKALYG